MLKRKYFSFLLLAVLFIAAAGCSEKEKQNPKATITLTTGEEIVITLYPDKAPNTVANFISLANSGFYDGHTFHRVISGFVVQGGDPKGDGTGGPDYTIDGEFSSNGFTKNDIKHTRGVVSMSRFPGTEESDNYNTAGSQFFIVLEEKSSLDGNYAAFGKVETGMEVVDAIGAVKTDSNDKPLEDIIIKTIQVETFGEDYGDPKANR